MSEQVASCKPRPRPQPRRAAGSALPAPATAGAVRTALAAVLAMAIALALHVEVPSLAVVFVLARGSAGALAMLAGGIGGAAAALVLLDLFDQSPFWMSAALLVLTTGATYLALGKRFPFAFVQGLLLLLVVVAQGLDTPGGAVRHAFYDLASVLIASFAAFVAGASQPVALPARLQATLADALHACASVARGEAAAATAALRLELLAGRARGLLPLTWPTRLASRARQSALRAATDAVEAIGRGTLALHALASTPRRPDARQEAEDLLRAFGDAAESVAALLPAVRGAVDVGHDERRARARGAARAARHRPLPAARAPGLSWIARRLGRGLAGIAAASPRLVPGAAAGGRSRHAAWHPPILDRFRLRHAVKSGASYLLVLWAWVAAGWGAVVPALVVAVLVATLATPLGATFRKAALRVGGVLAGGLLGLAVAVVLLPWITSLPAMCAVTGLGLLAFLSLQQRHERLTFAALQAAIAFTLVLVHGPGPDPTSRGPVDSSIGLAFGITVVVLVMHAVWPLDAASSARRALADVLAHAGTRLADHLSGDAHPAASTDAARRARAAREHAAGFTHEVELYGAQFGRPADDLAALFLAAAQTDALAALLARAPTPLAAPEPATAAAPAARATAALAAALRSLPGDAPPGDLGAALAALDRTARALAPARSSADVGTAVRAEVVCALALVLGGLARQLRRPTVGDREARSAA